MKIIIAAFLLCATLTAHAEASTLIKKVVIEGNHRIEADTILSYMTIKEGDKVTQAQIDDNLKEIDNRFIYYEGLAKYSILQGAINREYLLSFNKNFNMSCSQRFRIKNCYNYRSIVFFQIL